MPKSLARPPQAKTDVAIGKLHEILNLVPDDGATHYQIATLLMDNAGDQLTAIKHFERARDLEFQPMGVAYRLSRIFARTGRKKEALKQMDVLATGGFGLPNLIEGQSDYDSIREDGRFKAALVAINSVRFPCMGDKRRHAFDFWIGEWTVTSNGQVAGTNKHSTDSWTLHAIRAMGERVRNIREEFQLLRSGA